MKNYIIEKRGGFVVCNDNAESERAYATENLALIASNEDEAAYATADNDASAQDLSPIHWIQSLPAAHYGVLLGTD